MPRLPPIEGINPTKIRASLSQSWSGDWVGDGSPGAVTSYDGIFEVDTLRQFLGRLQVRRTNTGAVEPHFATRLDIRDFSSAEEDKLFAFSLGAFPHIADLLAALDTNGDRARSRRRSDIGVVWSDPNANATCIQLGDGDMLDV